MSLAELSRTTKIKECYLDRLEAAELEALPAQVFVRGFVCAYAREVGIEPFEALRRYKQHLYALERLQTPEPAPAAPEWDDLTEQSPPPVPSIDRRRFSVAMVVLLILVVATLTLSLLLRHGTSRGGGLSQLEATPKAETGSPSQRT
jgi:cytoskeletal protein RodZ